MTTRTHTPGSNLLIRRAAATLAVAATLLAGCKSTPTAATDDASLNTALQTRLQSDAGLAGQPVQASVQNGVATLSGSVDSAAAKSLAANDAAQIAGIRTVINDLSIGVPPTTPAVIVAPPTAPAPTYNDRRTATRVTPPTPAYRQPAPVDRRDERRDPNYAQNQQSSQNQQPYQNQQQQQPAAQPAVRNVTVPAGTGLSVRITQTLDSETTQPGTSFSGVLASDVVVDGLVAFPTGTRVSGHVDDAKDAGHFKGNSVLAISLNGISRRGENFSISTDTFSKEGNGRGKNTAEKAGGGAAVGAILGGIFGGGKGAAIGAATGGGLGAGANAITRGQQVQIPSETLVRFRLTTPVTVRASNGHDQDPGNGDLQRRNQ